MQISSRTKLYYIFLIVGLFITGLIVWLTVSSSIAGKTITAFLFSEQYRTMFLSGIVAAGISCFIGLFISFYFVLRLRKTTSFELFFFSAAAFTMIFEAARFVTLLLYFSKNYVFIIDTVSRAVISARFLGILCLLMGSLYPCGLNQSSIFQYFIGLLLLAIFFAVLQPVNSGTMDSSFLSAIGNSKAYYAVTIFMSLATVANYFVAGKNDSVFVNAGFLIAGFMISRQILQYAAGMVQVIIAGIVCAASAIIYIKILFTRYMWD